MAKIVGRPKYWVKKTDAMGNSLPDSWAEIFIMDREAWVSISVTEQFVSDAVGMPKMLFDILQDKLIKFKETHAQVGWPIGREAREE